LAIINSEKKINSLLSSIVLFYSLNAIFQSYSGNALADSTVVQNAHLCPGVFVATDANWVITVSIDPLGNYFGFTMLDTALGNEIVRFGFGIKDDGYANLP